MVPDGKTEDERNGRTDSRMSDTKTISLRLCRGIICILAILFCHSYGPQEKIDFNIVGFSNNLQ